ncbi:hypothetical protein SBOR_5483 [Sclerotinia borealis F-4128]|uniref:Uncharacterized protein n=1 Tax=Sclerotinia borealis (strain F-4128) TaxID=1432307 RepID=W9CHA7_SCLBF|nr:hypothetical protein SBOR_5483 [Sclerotinia borealis F-4128]
MISCGPTKAMYYAWAALRQALGQPAKDPPAPTSDFSVPTDLSRSTNATLQRVFVVDSDEQCFLTEGGTFKQPRLSGCESAILPVGIRPQGTFDGMRVWGLGKILEHWTSSSDESKAPKFGKPEVVTTKKVSFEALVGRWSIHQVRAFEVGVGDEDSDTSATAFLPLAEADLIQPGAETRFRCAAGRRCRICGEWYLTCYMGSYQPAPERPGFELRWEPYSCRSDHCMNALVDGTTEDIEYPVGPSTAGPLSRWSERQRQWNMTQAEVFPEEPEVTMVERHTESQCLEPIIPPVETAEDAEQWLLPQPLNLTVRKVGAPELGDVPEEDAENSEGSVAPLMAGNNSIVDSAQETVIPRMNGENLKSFSWADDDDEDW